MNIEKQLETAVKTNHLVLVVFYADWSPHYEWIGPCFGLTKREL